MHIEPHAPEAAPELVRHTLVVDASYNLPRGVTGIGIVHHATDRPRRDGPVIGTYSEAYVGVPAQQTEEFALLRALEIAATYGATRVKLRSDYSHLRRQLKRDHRQSAQPPGADLRSTILRLASTFAELKFDYVARRKNGWAHRLARIAVASQPPKNRSDIAWLLSSQFTRPAAPESGGSPRVA